jgi:hypothetical protein
LNTTQVQTGLLQVFTLLTTWLLLAAVVLPLVSAALAAVVDCLFPQLR